ncbi:MAG: isochorismatase family protein [Thiobacillaceae bacterium]
MKKITIAPGDALIIVDVQKDFLPGGKLAVKHGDEVVPVLNRYIDLFQARGLPIFATRDWHPANHCSFHEQGGIWPPHCVAQTAGAAFPSQLALPPATRVISKATTTEKDAYSGFEGTELESLLRAARVQRLFVGGLATDYCVLNTVRDARLHNYETFLLADAVRAVNVHPEDQREAMEEMMRLGVELTEIEALA